MSAVPASRVEVFDVTIPAGTAEASPLEVETNFAAGELVGVELLFPAGCGGLVGVRLAVGHAQAIPTTAGSWLVGNGETLRYDLVGQINNGAWSLIGYNADAYDHTLHVRYLVAEVGGGVGANAFASPTLAVLS